MALRIAAELQKTDPKRQVEFIMKKGLVANGDARLFAGGIGEPDC